MELFATAAKGTEPALRDELKELRFRDVKADRGGVHFTGDDREAWRACLESRVAIRILGRLARFPARTEQALYDGVREIDLGAYLDPKRTLAVTAFSKKSALTHTAYLAQLTKDAVVDRLRDKHGTRPDVDRRDPDVHLFLHLASDEATLLVDFSGESLHARGWRSAHGEAPLRETLAAAIVRLSRWDRKRPFVDPFCGAGTIAIEADHLARGVAPGLSRKRFGFQRWLDFDRAAAERFGVLREEVSAKATDTGPDIFGNDIDANAIATAEENAKRANSRAVFATRDVSEITPTDPPGDVVTNPPYGHRLDADARLYEKAARAFASLHGHRVTALLGAPGLNEAMRRKPLREHTMFNGDLECRLFTWEID